MATVYSLVCFGGLSGKTVTFTDSGDVVNLADHGLRQGVTGIVFSTTGSLPTGIIAGTTYYPRDGADAAKFTIYPTKADALAETNQVTFSGTGSGTHTVKSAYMIGLTSEQTARYGTAGSERIYNGLQAWYADRANSGATNIEHCEVGECFDDISVSYLSIQGTVAGMIVSPTVAGVYTSAFHGGIVGGGYRFICTSGAQNVVTMNMYRVSMLGIEICRNSAGAAQSVQVVGQGSTGCYGVVDSCIINGLNNGETTGVKTGAAMRVSNNIIVGCLGSIACGLDLGPAVGAEAYGNLVTKCTVGVKSINGQGKFYNNVSIGNGRNYSTRPASNQTAALRNVGDTNDLLEFSVTSGSANMTFSVGHNVLSATNTAICFYSTGTLPTVAGIPLVPGKIYWVKARLSATVITISELFGDAALVFDGVGTGTHAASAVWVTEDDPLMIDFSNPDSIFVDYANNDFRLTTGSPLINAGQTLVGLISGPSVDITGAIRPNYQPTLFPDEPWDCGPFEFDHGNGLAPLQVSISLSGMAEDSVLAVYKTSDGSAIINPTTIDASGAHSITYSYTGDVQIRVEVRKGTSGTKYLPYSAPGLITSSGFSLIVNQVADGVLNG